MTPLLRRLLLSLFVFNIELVSCVSPRALPASALTVKISDGQLHDSRRTRSTTDGAKFFKRQFSSHVDAKDRYSQNQVDAIQIVACTLAGISLVASLVTVFWFWRMRQKFRHRLIVLLIHADVMRSLWFFVFPLVTFSQGPVDSASAFCQAGGYLTQVAIEMADISILFIALHTALQVFNPSITRSGIEEGGLFKFRRLVYLATFIIPPFISALAYIRSTSEGYESTGPFCGLPLRPFWYRLGISWIPRYLVMFIIAALYIAIYIHVAVEFRVIGWLGLSAASSTDPRLSTSQNWTNTSDGTNEPNGALLQPLDEGLIGSERSHQTNINAIPESEVKEKIILPDSAAESSKLRGSIATSYTTLDYRDSRAPSGATDGFVDHVAKSKFNDLKAARGARLNSGIREQTEQSARSGKSKEMQKRHSATRRQLRNLFIYPVCYFLIWVLPFATNVMNYNDYYAQYPIFALNLLASACLASMGTVDCVVFSLREKPWKHIPKSDGTFIGSFIRWNYRPRPVNSRPRTPARKPDWQLSDLERADGTFAEIHLPSDQTSPSNPSGETSLVGAARLPDE